MAEALRCLFFPPPPCGARDYSDVNALLASQPRCVTAYVKPCPCAPQPRGAGEVRGLNYISHNHRGPWGPRQQRWRGWQGPLAQLAPLKL